MRYVLTFLGGAIGMYIILKVLSVKKSGTASQSTERFKELAQTQQVYNLLMTNEFRELVKTSQFKNFVKTLANEQLTVLAQTLAG